MKKIFIYTFAALFSALSYSQEAQLESVVLEKETGAPVKHAIVSIQGTTLATKTNENGEFVFLEKVPNGEHVVTVEKTNYDTKFFLINSSENQKIVLEKVIVEVTKDEQKRRNREEKLAQKRLRQAEKELRAKEKRIAKQERKLRKNNTVEIDYIQQAAVVEKIEEVKPFSEAQLKYAEILDTPAEELSKDIYDFIDEWMGVTYLWGGETKEGIDCSSFTQRLYTQAKGMYIERTAIKQHDSKLTDKFTGIDYLKEGDLLFFGGVSGPDKHEKVNHVGVYLHNNMFVHATSSRNKDGIKGVKISSLNDKYWKTKFVSAGRRLNNQ